MNKYDEIDLIIAMCISEFAKMHEDTVFNDMFDTYDSLIELVEPIRNAWGNLFVENTDEYKYISSFTFRYLEENYLD